MIRLVNQSFSEQHLYIMFIILQNVQYHLWLTYEDRLSYIIMGVVCLQVNKDFLSAYRVHHFS